MNYDYDGAKIVTLREERKWSSAELARRSGIRQPSLWALEHQVTKRPRAETMLRIANALGVPLKEIMKKQAASKSDAHIETMAALFLSLDHGNQQAILAAAEVLLRNQKR